MPVVAASEYSKKVGLYQTIAQREPVIITSHGREETVLISVAEYRRLSRRRRPYLIAELPDEDWRAIERAHREVAGEGKR